MWPPRVGDLGNARKLQIVEEMWGGFCFVRARSRQCGDDEISVLKSGGGRHLDPMMTCILHS